MQKTSALLPVLYLCLHVFFILLMKAHLKALFKRIKAHGHGLLLFHTQREQVIDSEK